MSGLPHTPRDYAFCKDNSELANGMAFRHVGRAIGSITNSLQLQLTLF